MKTHFKKHYTTGEVAKICGFKSSRVVAKLFDGDKIEGKLVLSQFQRRTTRVIPLKSLIAFMRVRDVSLCRLSPDLGSLISRRKKLREAIERSGKAGVLSRVNGLSRCLLEVIRILDPIDTMNGVSEDRRTVVIFEKLVELMKTHIAIRGQIAAVSKK